MKSHLAYADKHTKNLVHIKLVPENDNEKELLEKGENKEVIEMYYHRAVDEKLGNDYSLLPTIDESNWPWEIIAKVKRNGGLG